MRRILVAVLWVVSGCLCAYADSLEGIWLPIDDQVSEIIGLRVSQSNGKWMAKTWVFRPPSWSGFYEKGLETSLIKEVPLAPLGADPTTGSFNRAMAHWNSSTGTKTIHFSLKNGHLVVERSNRLTDYPKAPTNESMLYFRRLDSPEDIRLWESVNLPSEIRVIKNATVLRNIYNALVDEIGSVTDPKEACERLDNSIARVFPNSDPMNSILTESIPVRGVTQGVFAPFMMRIQGQKGDDDRRIALQYLWIAWEAGRWKVHPLMLKSGNVLENNFAFALFPTLPWSPSGAISDKDHLFVKVHAEGTNFGGSGVLVFKRFGDQWRLTQDLISDSESYDVAFGQKNGKESFQSVNIITRDYLVYLPGGHGSPKALNRHEYVFRNDRYVLKRVVYLPTAVSTADNLIDWALHKKLKKVREHCASSSLYTRFLKLLRDHPLGRDGYYDYSPKEEDGPIAPEGWGVYLSMGKKADKWMLVGIRPLD